MSSYRCPVCDREYTLHQASTRSYFCCGRPLERVGAVRSLPKRAFAEAVGGTRRSLETLLRPGAVSQKVADTLFQGDGESVVAVEVIPPAGNTAVSYTHLTLPTN